MKRTRGEKSDVKKKVRFADEECEIMPDETPIAKETPPEPPTGEKETEWLKDVREGEEAFDRMGDKDDGAVPLEPFNLDEERQMGTFGEDGFYVENREGRSEEADAWLSSSEATVCSIDVLRRHQEQQDAMTAAEEMPKPSVSQTTDLKKRIATFLQPRETVLMALRRLGRKNASEAQEKREQQMKDFGDLTELADALMNGGEIDAYSMYKEEFEHAVQSMEQPLTKELKEDGDDMFAEDSDSEQEKKRQSKVQSSSQPDVEESGTGKRTKVDVDFASWSISELKSFLIERSVDCSTFVEKGELIEKAKEVQQKMDTPASNPAPDGFAYQPESGYFYHTERGLYYDGSSRCYYDPRTTKWYDESWNELQQ